MSATTAGVASAVALGALLMMRYIHRRAPRSVVLAGTWKFSALALEAAARQLECGGSLLDAVERGINAVELDTAGQYFVGRGGLPNRDGIMQMDAALWDGQTGRCGAVMALERTTRAVSVARLVLERSIHNIFVGAGALAFKRECGGVPDDEPLTAEAAAEWDRWRMEQRSIGAGAHDLMHDTVGLVGVDEHGNLVVGTSTSGWAFKPAGRVGDSPLFGSGLCVDNAVGAAVATGDGEDIMRATLSHEVVSRMRRGARPDAACDGAIAQLLAPLPAARRRCVKVGVVAISKAGVVGAGTTICAANEHVHAIANDDPARFQYAVWRGDDDRGVRYGYSTAREPRGLGVVGGLLGQWGGNGSSG